MNREDIISMAAEIWNAGSEFPIPSSDDIVLFASKVAEAEREACAKVCDGLQDVPATEPRHCAEDIRAREQL